MLGKRNKKNKFYYLFVVLTIMNFIKSAKIEDFIKIRCSLSGGNTFYTWTGSILNYSPQTKPEILFNFVGFNVARCLQDEKGLWMLLTRELAYYLNPKTNEKLTTWKNSFGEYVTVMPVSNDPVNSNLSPVPIQKISENEGIVVSDFPLFYPNPLHVNETFKEYSGIDEFYQAGEFFKFYFNIEELNLARDELDQVTISWNRVGPYLPWMKMGEKKGHLVYSTYGRKSKDISSLPQWLQDDVRNRLPLYLNAPSKYEEPNETAFTYFKKHFEEYLRGELFPIPTKESFSIK